MASRNEEVIQDGPSKQFECSESLRQSTHNESLGKKSKSPIQAVKKSKVFASFDNSKMSQPTQEEIVQTNSFMNSILPKQSQSKKEQVTLKSAINQYAQASQIIVVQKKNTESVLKRPKTSEGAPLARKHFSETFGSHIHLCNQKNSYLQSYNGFNLNPHYEELSKARAINQSARKFSLGSDQKKQSKAAEQLLMPNLRRRHPMAKFLRIRDKLRKDQNNNYKDVTQTELITKENSDHKDFEMYEVNEYIYYTYNK